MADQNLSPATVHRIVATLRSALGVLFMVTLMAGMRRAQALGAGSNDGLAFTHATGTPFQPWWVSRASDRLVGELGLPRIRFQDLRHTAATIGQRPVNP